MENQVRWSTKIKMKVGISVKLVNMPIYPHRGSEETGAEVVGVLKNVTINQSITCSQELPST